MLQAKYLQISLAVIIFLAGFTSSQLLFKDVSNSTTLTHVSSETTLASTPQQLLNKACEAKVPIEHKDHMPAPKNAHQLAQVPVAASCDQDCIKQRIDTLFEHVFGNIDNEVIDIGQYSSLLLDIADYIQQDSSLLAKFEEKLMEQIASTSEFDGQKSDAVVAMVYHLPEDDRSRIAWQIAQSSQDPNMSKLAFELLPDDAQLHTYIATNAMESIFAGDSAEALDLLVHVVSYGSNLSETTIPSDLAYLHTTTPDRYQRDLALSLLAQINPDSQAFKDTLAVSLNSEPGEVVSALRTLARSSRHPTVYRGEGKPLPSDSATANRKRIQTLANDPTTPIDVRIASLEVLKAFDSKERY